MLLSTEHHSGRLDIHDEIPEEGRRRNQPRSLGDFRMPYITLFVRRASFGVVVWRMSVAAEDRHK